MHVYVFRVFLSKCLSNQPLFCRVSNMFIKSLYNTYVNSSHLRIFSHVVFKTEVKLCGFY